MHQPKKKTFIKYYFFSMCIRQLCKALKERKTFSQQRMNLFFIYLKCSCARNVACFFQGFSLFSYQFDFECASGKTLFPYCQLVSKVRHSNYDVSKMSLVTILYLQNHVKVNTMHQVFKSLHGICILYYNVMTVKQLLLFFLRGCSVKVVLF